MPNDERHARLLLQIQKEQSLLVELQRELRDALSAICAEPLYLNIARDRLERSLRMIKTRIADNAR